MTLGYSRAVMAAAFARRPTHELISGDSLLTDAAVIARVLDGDTEAFGVLVDRYQDTFAAYATQMTGSEQDAADIIQESLVRAYKSLRRCKDRSNFKGWLFRIVSNQCKTHLTKRRRRKTEPLTGAAAGMAAPEDAGARIEADEMRRKIEEALLRLPWDQREALILRYIEGLSLREMAAALSASQSALKMRLLRGRAALREELQGVLL